MSESIVIALIGVLGAIIGSVATVSVEWISHYLKKCDETNKEKPRRDLLLKMLSSPNYEWRKLETLMHVIGSDEETTKRLLIEVGARASENGEQLWGLIERNPLPTN